MSLIDPRFTSLSNGRSQSRSRHFTRRSMSGQTKLDEFFATKVPSTNKRAPPLKKTPDDYDDFDQIFQNKRRRVDPPVAVRKKRSVEIEEEEEDHHEIIAKKIRSTEDTIDLLDIFNSKTKGPVKKPVKGFFDLTEMKSIKEEEINNDRLEEKDYVHVQPVLITGGEWLSKDKQTTISTQSIPDDQRNLMNIHYAPLITPKPTIRTPSSTGKSFHKQMISSNVTIVRKENLQSCYNALLEDINRIGTTKKPIKSSVDEDESPLVDFFDLPVRKKKF